MAKGITSATAPKRKRETLPADKQAEKLTNKILGALYKLGSVRGLVEPQREAIERAVSGALAACVNRMTAKEPVQGEFKLP